MEQKAKLIKVLTENGVSRTGNNWQKATAIVEWLDGQYPKQLALTTMNKAEALSNLPVGVEYNWHFDVTSREYNGRYFTEASVWRWDSLNGEQVPQPQQNVAQPQPQGQQYAPQGQQYAPQGQQYAPQGQQYAPQGQQFNVPQQGYASQPQADGGELPF